MGGEELVLITKAVEAIQTVYNFSSGSLTEFQAKVIVNRGKIARLKQEVDSVLCDDRIRHTFSHIAVLRDEAAKSWLQLERTDLPAQLKRLDEKLLYEIYYEIYNILKKRIDAGRY